MKNFLNLNQLSMSWTEKQTPQRAIRYAAMLIMLLTLGVGQISAFDLYVRGIGTWDPNNNTHMVDRGSNTQILYLNLSTTSYSFKIADDTWGTYNYGAGSGQPSLGTAYSLVSGSNTNISFTPSVAGTYLFSVNTSTWKLTITKVEPTTAAPSAVVSGTNKMFYIKGYDGLNYLTNGSNNGEASTSYPMMYAGGYSYVNTSASLTTYYYISNNPSGWGGDSNNNIKTAGGGELFNRDGTKTAAASMTTHSTSMSGDVLTITSKTSKTTSSYNSLPLYIQYYIDGTFVGVTYSAATASYASIAATGSNQTSTYNCSSLTNGSHTLKTVLTDGLVYYVASSDNFSVAHSYSITYKDEGNEDYSGSNLASLPSSYTYGTGIATLTDGVRAGYSFVGWYDTKECDGSKVTSISSSAEGAKTLYAKWEELSGGVVTLTAGTGGQVSLDNSNWDSSKTKSGITTATAFNIYAQESTGYTFSAWAKSSGQGTITSTSSASTSFTPVAYQNAELTASFTENMSTLSVSRTIDEGSPSIAAPTVTDSRTTVGYVTTAEITAAAAATGYALTSWTVTNGARTDGGGATANPITVRSNGNASESVTVAANYTIQSYTISASNSNVTYSPASGTSFKYGATGSKMTITPKSGYKITGITSNNGAITASADNNAAGSWSVTGTMPAANVTLTVTTAAVSTVYLQGRFRIRTASGVESYKSLSSATASGWSSEWVTSGTSQIQMAYNYITGVYDLVTYRSAAELKADGNLYFYLRVGSTNTYPTSDNLTVPSSKPESANAQTSTGRNFYFNDNGDYINVVLHYDDANKKLWYTGTAETVYSTTCYAGDHGSINAKGTAIAKNGNSTVNIGTNSPISATPESGYSFDKWVTTGSVTVADQYSASTTVSASAAGGTVTATYLANSGWYMHGVIDGVTDWCSDGYWPHRWPIDRPYRGVSGVYYRRISSILNGGYFGIHDGSNKYSGDATGSDCSYNGSYHDLVVNGSKCFQASTAFSNKWVVINTTGTKKIWIQSPTTYYTVTVSNEGSGARGTVVLKEKSYGNLATNEYASGETIRVEIDTVAHYSIKSVKLGDTNVTMTHSSGTKFTGDVVMPASDKTLTVTYTPWHKIQLAASPAAAADAPTAAKTTGGATVANNSYVLDGTSVTFTKDATPNSGYTWDGWYKNSEGTGDALGTGDTYAESITAATTMYAVYTENDYTVTVQSSDATYGGTVASGSVTGHKTTKVTLPTATAKAGYYFNGWEVTSGTATITDASSATAAQINGLTDGATVRANFAPIWTIAGGDAADEDPDDALGNWNTNTNTLWKTYAGATDKFAYFDITTLLPNTDYEFKVVQRSTGDYVWWRADDDEDQEINYGKSNARLNIVGADGENFRMRTAGAGTYTFDINLDDSKHPITVRYPTSWTVTFGYGTGGSEVTATVEDATTITTGQYAASGKDITFSQTAATGYTFKGWYDASSGGSAISSMASDDVYDNIAGNIAVYAQYTPNEYKITFDATTNGGTLSGASPQDVTYDETSVASCPTAVKDGYCFDGWYTAASAGVKVINPDGTLVAGVTDWTDGDGKWKVADDAEVYAVYVTSETLIDQPARIAGKRVAIDTLDAKNHPEIDSVIVHQQFSCTPTGNYNVAYTLCYSNHTPLDRQPTIHYGTGAGVGYDTVWMPMDEIQVYELVAYMRTGTTRGSGDSVTVDTALISVEKTWPIKVRYVMDGIDLREPTEWSAYPSVRTSMVRVMKEQQGFILDSLEYGVGITVDSVNANWLEWTYATYIKASNASTITAHYKIQDTTVYFFNTFEKYWYSTKMRKYEYGADGYWSTTAGAGAYDLTSDTVKRVSYDDAREGEYKSHLTSGKTKMSFTSRKMDGSSNFWGKAGTENPVPYVIYRDDYDDALKMFVPVTTNVDEDYIAMNKSDGGEAHYYRGFWVRYSPDRDSTGYFLRVYNQVAEAGATEIQSLPLRLTQTGEGNTWELTATMDLEAGKTYGFKITKANTGGTVWLSHNGTLTSADHTGKVLDATSDNIGLTTTSAGDYTFHVFCKAVTPANPSAITAAEVQGALAVTVDYATTNGDFRVVYQDDDQLDLTDGVGVEAIASQTIRARANGQDTVTFFVRKDAENRVMKFQKFTDGAWDDIAGGTIALTNTADQPFTVSKDTTYQIYLQQNADGTEIEATGMEYYSGKYYLRTDCVDEHKWDYKQSMEAHQMLESDYATHLATDPFSHYFVSWVRKGGNVKYVVATEYSPCLTDTLITDSYANVAGGNLPSGLGANVRFMYNKKTNGIKRAYLQGSEEDDPDYLKLTQTSSDKMKDKTGASALTAITFADLGNWTYQAEIKAQPGLTGKLTAEYNGIIQYFRGSAESSETILGGTGESWQNIVMTYDFKTNRLICAWTPGDTIDESMSINADVMIIRRGQRDAEQIVFKTNETKLTDVKYIYGVIELSYNDLVGMMNRWDYWSYEHCVYYISFPFDVLVSDITGVGKIGVDWRIQRYNGAKRAEGWFTDGPKTFWEDVHAGDTLHAYEGYNLMLARTRFNDSKNDIWKNKTYGDKVYLFFPSLNATTGIISDGEVTFTVPSHECTKDQVFVNSSGMLVNHKVTDSHWNMLGTPLFENKTAFSIAAGPTIGGERLQYLYAWNSAGNTLGIQLTLDASWKFKTMYSYMVQYTGEVTFKGSTVNKIVAADRDEETKNYHVNLELNQDGEFIGRTYVELRENAVDTFLLNEDICMFRNGVNADLFTYAGTYEAGANVLPIGDHVVPVGLYVKKAGTYTFSMPDDFDGTVTLIDNFAQTRTNLAIDDYEIALPTGEISDRFYLEININKVPTAIDGASGDGSFKDGKAHKFIMNDMMYILNEGQLFDATGRRVE